MLHSSRAQLRAAMFTHRIWPTLLAALAIMLLASCDNSSPVIPNNGTPTILALTVFPHDIGRSDSAIVVCNANDPDGDVLRYDWFTDGRLDLGGTNGGSRLFNTEGNALVVYHGGGSAVLDTAWVQCIARDPKGGAASQTVTLFIHQ